MQTRDPRSVPTNVIPFPRKRPRLGQIALGMTFPRKRPRLGQIALGMIIRGDFVRFSPELRERFARMAAEAGRRHPGGRA
jgi:hypothetical protein